MRDPFIAIDAGTNLRSHARALRRSWASALGGAPGTGVRPLIEASWRRTERAGIDPDHPAPRRAFAPDVLEDYRDSSGLRGCIDVLRTCLRGFAQDAEHIMVVVDADCRILWLEGDLKVRHRADGIAFAEGMDWTEDSVGTNAIGTALAIDHAVQVFCAEHFSAKQHPWWCSAAPIHDPVTRTLVGVVDLSGPMHTAHPYSLALVRAAASMAEEWLRTRHELEDGRLRRAYVEQTAGRARGGRAALVAADGRVLEAGTPALVGGRVDVARDGGLVALPDGATATAEPLAGGRGFVLWEAGGVTAPARPVLRLELLEGSPRARRGAAAGVDLSLRQAEVLCLLALHPEGLTARELAGHLYGEGATVVSARAEVSRLRAVLGEVLGTRPYRFTVPVSADLLDVERALRRGDVTAALEAYRGPLLPASTSPRVRRARAELEGSLRRAAMSGGLDGLWAWLESRSGREDEEALAHFVRRAGGAAPRRAVAAARLRALQTA